MSDYEKILVAIDGSSESEKILTSALVQAAGNAGKLAVVLVFEPLPISYGYELNMADLELAVQQQQEKTAASIRQLVADKCPGIDEKSIHFLRGKPAAEIRELAKRLNVDLLVIGSHGQGALRALLGSTANGVLHGIHCDVLTVRV
ncbi:MAG: universal stress protein [Pseudomonadales bacterium]|nr:universal stress protein [Pseudomonadales bacterium]